MPSEAGNKTVSGSASAKIAGWPSCNNQSAFKIRLIDKWVWRHVWGICEASFSEFPNKALAWLECSYQSTLLQIKVTGTWLLPVVGSSLGGDTGTFQQRFPGTSVISHHHSPLWMLLVLTVSLRSVRDHVEQPHAFRSDMVCTERRERLRMGVCSTSDCFDGTVDSSIKVYLTRSRKPGAVSGMLTETARTQPLLE